MTRKKSLFAAVFSFILAFGILPATAFAQEQSSTAAISPEQSFLDADVQEQTLAMVLTDESYPECAHGNIGCSGGTTMYYMNRITYRYDEFGNKYERVWYKCSICGYETYVEFPI